MSGINLITLPIGNDKDITLGALECLKIANTIYCEDTRVLKALLKRLEIDYSEKKIDSYHDHSNELKLQKIIDQALENECCFVSDAGSPIISDPGFLLAKAAIQNNVKLKSYGGVSAPIIALELSGLSPAPFHFHAFLPRDKGKILSELEQVNSVYGTHIFFEGVSRVKSTIELIAKVCPDSQVVIARELTKEYESIYRFKAGDYKEVIESIVLKGEFVILIENSIRSQARVNSELISQAQSILDNGPKPKLVSKLIASILSLNAKEVYKQLNESK